MAGPTAVGGRFQVSAGGRVVRLNCPENSMPGDTVHFTVRDNVPVMLANDDNGNPGNRSRSINGGGIEGGSNPPSLPLDSASPSPPSLSSPSPSPIIMSTKDALISIVFNRLSGVYRDSSRVMRDAKDLLLSSHLGSQLHPRAGPLSMTPGRPCQSLGLMDSPDNIPIERRHQNAFARVLRVWVLSGISSSSLMLMLKGTLPMTYCGVIYHIPIEMFLPPLYPARPPIVFVRPTATMSIKASHKHVGQDGMVYMPYLLSWKSETHDLTELAALMSSMFGDEPPCYARPSNATSKLEEARLQEKAEAERRPEAQTSGCKRRPKPNDALKLKLLVGSSMLV
ncbi:hypothetical protein ACHAW5_011049 [Stephanodiscus triporus]|uniref:UEV domain-containing protein n=1 Tax=Stephanodiscus triporus TaxID=2934178 RepID=A0ABD3NKL9_9STRA